MITMDLTQGVFLLNGHNVSGYSSADDCLSFPQDLELATTDTGADGKVVACKTGEKGGEVTLKLQPNSPSVVFLGKLIKQQQLGLPIVINGEWVNPAVGEMISCRGGVIKKGPKGTTYGKGKAAEKVYVLHFEVIDDNPELMLLGSMASLGTSLL